MSSELMRMTENRPAVIEVAGGRVFVSVHDEYYRHTYREWKNTLKLAHPDMRQQHWRVETIPAHAVKARVHPYKGATGTFTVNIAAHRRGSYTRKRHGRGDSRFKLLQRRFDAWKKREAAWYAHHDLAPPQW